MRNLGALQNSDSLSPRHTPRRGEFAGISGQRTILEQLEASQGIKPVVGLDQSRGDFWPDDESIDDFVGAVRQWRENDTEA